MGYRDLREWLAIVDEFGEIKRINGAHWRLEMGGLADVIYREHPGTPPAILFDEIVEYPKGYRALFGQISSPRRLALTLDMPLEYDSMMDFIRAYREKIRVLDPIPPRVVGKTVAEENLQEGEAVDLYRFPAPIHHELDGGRYFGTGHVVITRDPDEGWVNLGAYRLQLHDKNTLGFYSSPGKHGTIHRQKYFDRGQPCPVAVAIGCDPILWLVGSMEIPLGMSEYDYAGALKGRPMEVVEGKLTGLPIPAQAEIIVEGEVLPHETRDEGPFGEWPGYYASTARPEPIIRVKRVMYRSNPIMTCSQPARPRHEHSFHRAVIRSALIWDELEKVGVPDVRGVWCHEAGGSRLLTIVAIKQRYQGHAKQAATIAAQCHAGAYLGRYVMVVDEDIDPSNTYDVLWAMTTRVDPERDIDILRDTWGSKIDPLVRKPAESYHNSRALINACRPYEWLHDFPPVTETSPELRDKLIAKFGKGILE
ncbi:MAG: UbiD family decarboxylase [Chloroflexi bacterium]|nr:UbiD family decarboxylase [Chloroflexota bacterium]